MKGLFIPEITAEMFRNGCLESIEALMAEGKIYDIEYPIHNTIIIPKGATNGDMFTALFGEKALITLDAHNYLKSWWNAPYKSESEEEE